MARNPSIQTPSSRSNSSDTSSNLKLKLQPQKQVVGVIGSVPEPTDINRVSSKKAVFDNEIGCAFRRKHFSSTSKHVRPRKFRSEEIPGGFDSIRFHESQTQS